MQKIINSLGTLILSVLLAAMVWYVAVEQENPPIDAEYEESIPLEVENLPDNSVIFGEVPEEVKFRLRAPQSSWDELAPAKFRAWIDLNELAPGLHDIPVQVEVSDRSVTIEETNPGTVNIRLEKLAEKEYPITLNIVDSPSVGYVARTPILDPVTATVRGPESVVEQVTKILGEVYLRQAKETVKRSVPLMARDVNGDTISRLTIDPEQIEVTIPVDQRFGYRDVAVRVLVVGDVAPGYWISNVTVDPSTVTVVGGPSALSEISGYVNTFEVDVSGAISDITERVALQLPSGVSIVQPETGENDTPSGVQVNIDISSVEGGQTVNRPITFQGLSENQTAVARPSRVDVILSGPLPRLQALTFQDVKVTADLYGLGVGVHKVKPSIVVPETLRVESVLPEIVEIQISLSPSATPTRPPTATATPVITTTLTLTETGSLDEQ